MRLMQSLFSNSYFYLLSDQYQYFQKPLVQLQLSAQQLPRLTLVFGIFFLRIVNEIITFLPVVKAFNLEYVFLFLIKNNFNICSRGVRATTLSLSSVIIRISLVDLVFLAGYTGDRLFYTKHISTVRVNGLIFLVVFILFFG